MTVRLMRWLIAGTFLTGLYGSASAQTLDSTRTDSSAVWSHTTRSYYTRLVVRTDTVTDTLWLPKPVPAETTVTPVPIPVPPPTMLVKLLTGAQSTFDTRTKPLAPRTLVNADNATWTGSTNNPNNWAGGVSGVWRGGIVTGTWNQSSTPWSSYHPTAALHVRVDSALVLGFRVQNYGDAVRFMDSVTTYFTLRGSHFSDIHDDCVENDTYKNGLAEDNLFDGCYVAFSMRAASAVEKVVDGRGKTYTIRGNVVRLKAFALTAAAPNTSGGFFKVGNNYPERNIAVVVENNVFRADAKPGTGTLCLNQYGKFTARNNVLVWTGAGDYPCALPPGWTLTRDVTVWDRAVAEWKARHP